jgi:hypothetical protein
MPTHIHSFLIEPNWLKLVVYIPTSEVLGNLFTYLYATLRVVFVFFCYLLSRPNYLPKVFLPTRSRLHSWSSEQPIFCCWCCSCHTAASSLVRRACAIRRISLIALSLREYYCSSLRLPARQRLPHLLSSVRIEGPPSMPTVHSCQRRSTVFTARDMRCVGGCASA